ncbi:hypothetical protein GCM10023148_31380 [Actinokineospora soli]
MVVGALCMLPTVALAQGAVEDPRATQHTGNVAFEPGERDDCPTLWPGSHGVNLTDSDPSEQYIDVLTIPSGIEVVGVIVKGGDKYNKYDAADLGALPWLDLYSPLNKGGNIPAVSHWFACAVEDDTTTTTTTTTIGETTTTTTSPGQTTTTSPGETTTDTTSPAVTTTTDATAPGSGDDDDLAETGANPGWLLITGLLLLLAGGLALFSPRIRAAIARR